MNNKALNLGVSFDAYTCSIDCEFPFFSKKLENLGFFRSQISPKFGYETAFSFEDNKQNFILVMFGGVSELLYVSCMGHFSNTIFELTRDFLPCPSSVVPLMTPRLNRADVKIDFDSKNMFDFLASKLISLANQKNIKISQVGDWALGREGRTLYVGSRSSSYMIRLYEKHKQKGYEHTDLVRLELEIKPQKKNEKERAFLLNSQELIETATNYAPIFSELIENYSDKVSLTTPRKLSTLEITARHLSKQYASTFEKLLEISEGDLSKFYNILLTGDLDANS